MVNLMKNNPVLKIKSTGPINEANIDIKKINIVGGVNGSGKTTVAKLFYCFFKLLSDKKDYHLHKRFVDMVNIYNENFNRLNIQFVNQNFQYDDSFEDVLNEFLLSKNLFLEHELDKEFFPKDLSYEEGYEHFFGEFDSLIRKLTDESFGSDINILYDLMSKESLENLWECDFVFEWGSFKFVGNNYLNESKFDCHEHIPDVFYIDTGSIFDLARPNFIPEHTLHIRDTLDEEAEWWKNLYNYAPKDLIEYVQYDGDILEDYDDRLPHHLKKELRKLMRDPESNLPTKNKEILSKIENIIQGKYLSRDTSFCFAKSINSKIISTSQLDGTPSGIKQIGIIQLLLLKGKLKNGSYLIIDEPEVNLHPNWQFKFAEILVLLVKELDINLYINSHSPLFIESMDAFIEFYDMQNEVNYYLSEESEKYDKYNFNKVNSDELYKIYDNLGDAYDLIDQLRLKKHLGD